jgi:hypothetical protein
VESPANLLTWLEGVSTFVEMAGVDSAVEKAEELNDDTLRSDVRDEGRDQHIWKKGVDGRRRRNLEYIWSDNSPHLIKESTWNLPKIWRPWQEI